MILINTYVMIYTNGAMHDPDRPGGRQGSPNWTPVRFVAPKNTDRKTDR
jgi:hypothetical protein